MTIFSTKTPFDKPGLKRCPLLPIPETSRIQPSRKHAVQHKESRPIIPHKIAIALLGLMLAGCQSIPLFPLQSDASGTDSVKPNMITPLVEKRETIMATGYAVISIQNHKNPSQQRLLAIRASKLDAYRALTEQVYGQHLDATTTVADMVVMNDTFRTRVEGVIYGAQLVSKDFEVLRMAKRLAQAGVSVQAQWP